MNELDELDFALRLLEQAIDALEQAGEPGCADMARKAMSSTIDRYAAEGGDRTMFDAALY